MKLTYRPITAWPGAYTDPRRGSPFSSKTTWSATLQLLDTELRALGVDEAVLQVDSPNERDFRLDGALRADARLRSPAVILSFQHRAHGPLQYPCDTFDKTWGHEKLEGWQVNVRAIALGLEALRKVDRYGIAGRGQQYTGWRQLPPGVATTKATMTLEEAARVIATGAAMSMQWREALDDIDNREHLYRVAAKRLHPDAGGNAGDFKRLAEAKELLDKFGGRQ